MEESMKKKLKKEMHETKLKVTLACLIALIVIVYYSVDTLYKQPWRYTKEKVRTDAEIKEIVLKSDKLLVLLDSGSGEYFTLDGRCCIFPNCTLYDCSTEVHAFKFDNVYIVEEESSAQVFVGTYSVSDYKSRILYVSDDGYYESKGVTSFEDRSNAWVVQFDNACRYYPFSGTYSECNNNERETAKKIHEEYVANLVEKGLNETEWLVFFDWLFSNRISK